MRAAPLFLARPIAAHAFASGNKSEHSIILPPSYYRRYAAFLLATSTRGRRTSGEAELHEAVQGLVGAEVATSLNFLCIAFPARLTFLYKFRHGG